MSMGKLRNAGIWFVLATASALIGWFIGLILKDQEPYVLNFLKIAGPWVVLVGTLGAVFYICAFKPTPKHGIRKLMATGATAVLVVAVAPSNGIVVGDDEYVGGELPNEASIPIPLPKPSQALQAQFAESVLRQKSRDAMLTAKTRKSKSNHAEDKSYEIAQLPERTVKKKWSLFSGGGGFGDSGDCPIAFDMDFSGSIETTGETTSRDKLMPSSQISRTVRFDLQGNGSSFFYEWLISRHGSRGDAFLVDNRDGKAEFDINNGRRLFGNEGGRYKNGYQKLALDYDADRDGLISGDERKGLALWYDNGDGIVQPGELVAVLDAGVKSIGATFAIERNEIGQRFMRSQAILEDGREVLVEDIWLGREEAAFN